MEGSVGPVDTALITKFPDKEIREKTARYLMDQGKLSAAEFFSILNEGKVALYGMDDERLYQENLEAFKSATRDQKENAAELGRLKVALSKLEEIVYSPELLQLARNSVLDTNGSLKFTQRWKLVATLADKYALPYQQYPNIASLLDALAMEKKLDFNRVNSEREDMMNALVKIVSREDLEDLVLQSIAFKLGRLSTGSFSTYLLEIAKKQSMALSAYPNLSNYAAYMALYETIDVEALKDEIADLEDKIREKLFRNDEERALYRLEKQTDVISDLFDVKLTSASLNYFRAHASEFDQAGLNAFLSACQTKYGLVVPDS